MRTELADSTRRGARVQLSSLPGRPWTPHPSPGSRAMLMGSLSALLLAVLLWTAASRMTFVIPSPVKTMTALITDLRHGSLAADFRVSAAEIGLSILIGTVLGTVIGVIMGVSALVRTALQSFITAMYGLPKIVLYPLFIPVLGVGASSKVAVGVVFCIFPVILTVAGATAGMPPVYRKLARSLRVKPHQFLIKIVLPITLRALVTGVRVGLSLAVLGVVLSEFVASYSGVGLVMNHYYTLAQYDGLFATVIGLLVITFLVSWVLWRIEKAYEWK